MHESGLATRLMTAATAAVPSPEWRLDGLTIEISGESHLDPDSLRLHLAALAPEDLNPSSIRVHRNSLDDPEAARLTSVSVSPR